jgi:hypothetical protein
MQIYEKKQYGQLRTIKNPSLRSFWKRAAGDAAAGSYLWLTPWVLRLGKKANKFALRSA